MGQAKKRGSYVERVKLAMGSKARMPEDMLFLEGEGANSPAAGLARAQRSVTINLLADKTEDALAEAHRNAAWYGTEVCEKFHQSHSSEPPIACSPGCYYCCSQAVAVTISEIAALIQWIGSLPDDHKARLKERVLAASEKTMGMSVKQRFDANVLCPLLEGNLCGPYEARPLACHGMNSKSRAECESAFSGSSRSFYGPIRYSGIQRLTFSGIATGVRAGLVDAGLPGHQYEMIGALAIALQDPLAIEKWLSGSRVFETAVHDGNAFTEFTD